MFARGVAVCDGVRPSSKSFTDQPGIPVKTTAIQSNRHVAADAYPEIAELRFSLYISRTYQNPQCS